jgi:hypothetical protein
MTASTEPRPGPRMPRRHPASEHRHAHPQRFAHLHPFAHPGVWALAIALVLLLVWPVQVILAAMFVGAVAVVVTTFTAVTDRRLNAAGAPRRAQVRRHIFDVGVALAAVGLVLIALWPATMAIATILLALAAFGLLGWIRLRHPAWWES